MHENDILDFFLLQNGVVLEERVQENGFWDVVKQRKRMKMEAGLRLGLQTIPWDVGGW